MKSLSKKSKLVVCASMIFVSAVAIVGVVLFSQTNASSEEYISPERQAMLDHKQKVTEELKNKPKSERFAESATRSPEEEAEDLKWLKIESEYVEEEYARDQRILDIVGEKLGRNDLSVYEECHDREVLAIIDCLNNCELTEDEYSQIEGLLNYYAMCYNKNSEIGKKINETTHYYDDFEYEQYLLNTSQLEYD